MEDPKFKDDEVKKKLGLPEDARLFYASDKSALKASENYSGKEKAGYRLDLKDAHLVDEEEFNKMLDDERPLRDKLRTVDIYDKDPAEIVKLMKENNLIDVLTLWASAHRRNRAMQMKKKIDVLLVPSTRLLLRAADLLKQ